MRRTKAASTYGLRTILSGTLLPARAIAPVAAPLLRRADAEGHEIAVHAWDHVEWHDRLPSWSLERVRKEVARAFDAFESAVGRPARASAAPGWMVSAASFEVEDERGLLYASDGRGTEPFLPTFGGKPFRTMQIPTTLPTWDEQQGRSGSEDEMIALYRGWVREKPLSVHTIHAEVEGGILAAAFERQLDAWIADGVRFVTLEEIARECEAKRDRLPRHPIVMKEIEGRAGEVAVVE